MILAQAPEDPEQLQSAFRGCLSSVHRTNGFGPFIRKGPKIKIYPVNPVKKGFEFKKAKLKPLFLFRLARLSVTI
jgi:hypothetical protein